MLKIVNASGWNEYIISITNPNEEDIQKTIFLEGTRYNWDATGCWVRDLDFDGKTVATLENITVHPGYRSGYGACAAKGNGREEFLRL